MAITLEKTGARIYFLGDTFAAKDKIKSMGGHWDGDRRAWWVGSAKADEAAALVASLSAAPAAGNTQERAKVGDDAKVVAKAKYKGRSYYVLWMGTCSSGAEKARLTVLDGSIDFWADLAQVEITKRYQPREYRGRTEYTTLGSIRRFIERQSKPETRRGECTECGAWGPSGESCPECGGEGSYV